MLLRRACVEWISYAEDDSMAPPSHGAWLASHFGSKQGVKTSIRSEDKWLGDFTYFPSFGPAYQAAEATMPKTLLDLCAQE